MGLQPRTSAIPTITLTSPPAIRSATSIWFKSREVSLSIDDQSRLRRSRTSLEEGDARGGRDFDVGQLLLNRRGKIRFKAMLQHDLPSHHLEVNMCRVRVVHEIPVRSIKCKTKG
jgi:hypothetical protein